MRRHALPAAGLAAVLLATPLHASSPLIWEMGRPAAGVGSAGEEKLSGVAVGSNGEIALSPALRPLFPEGDATPPPVVWDAAIDDAGNLWVGTGHSGALYRIDAKGKATKEFETNRLGVGALAAAPDGGIFAATFPSGAVYQVEAGKDPVTWLELEDRYIWSLATAGGSVFAATGLRGILYRAREAGESSVLLDSDQTHVTALAVDRDGQIIAGTDPDGLVIQLTDTGTSRVLLDTDLREVAAIATSSDGTIHAASVSDEPIRPPARTGEKSDLTIEVKEGDEGAILEEIRAGTIRIDLADLLPPPARDGEGTASRLYRIESGKAPRIVWKSDTERIGALADLGSGVLVLGTGGPEGGAIRRLEPDGGTTLLQRLEEPQVTALRLHRDGRLYAGTANPGRVYVMDAEPGSTGEYVSRALDAGRAAAWGTLTWESETPAGTRVEVMTRSGNRASPDASWSEWTPTAPVERGSGILSPPARFLQWKATLSRLQTREVPAIRKVRVTMLPHNRPPELTALAVHRTGEAIEPAKTGGTETKDDAGEPPAGMRWIAWTASDPDADALLCSVQVRPAGGDGTFDDLARAVRESPWAFDDRGLAEGRYIVRVAADDSPANPASRALGASRETAFLVDRTPPEVTWKPRPREAQTASAEALATDALGRIDRAEYGIRSGEEEPRWIPLPCGDGICDTSRESFLLPATTRRAGEKLLLRVHDEAGNSTTLEVPSP